MSFSDIIGFRNIQKRGWGLETSTTYSKSLGEVNQSIAVPQNAPFWRTLKVFIGPGALVAVGYMDPGNWITSVVGGATYKYVLLSVVLISSLIAMQLQQMAGKLGIVTRQDLAQATEIGRASCRERV